MQTENTIFLMVKDLMETHTDLMNLAIQDVLALVSYVLDGKDIENREGFEHYLHITDTINKLLYHYYNKSALDNNLFKSGGMLTLLTRDDDFIHSTVFRSLRDKRKENLLKQFPQLSPILEGLLYQGNSSQ